MELAALNDRVVEHVGDRTPQGLGAVDYDQPRPGGVQATLTQVGQQLTHHRGVLGGALGQGEWDLRPIDGDAEGDDHTGVLGHPDAID
jgi:hypothetical protein